MSSLQLAPDDRFDVAMVGRFRTQHSVGRQYGSASKYEEGKSMRDSGLERSAHKHRLYRVSWEIKQTLADRASNSRSFQRTRSSGTEATWFRARERDGWPRGSRDSRLSVDAHCSNRTLMVAAAALFERGAERLAGSSCSRSNSQLSRCADIRRLDSTFKVKRVLHQSETTIPKKAAELCLLLLICWALD